MTSKKIALRWGEPLTRSAPSAVVHQLSPRAAAAAGRRLWTGEEEEGLCLTFQLHPLHLHPPQAVTTLNNVWLGWD